MGEGIWARGFPERGAGQAGGLPRFLGNGQGFTLIELLVVVTMPFRKRPFPEALPPN